MPISTIPNPNPFRKTNDLYVSSNHTESDTAAYHNVTCQSIICRTCKTNIVIYDSGTCFKCPSCGTIHTVTAYKANNK